MSEPEGPDPEAPQEESQKPRPIDKVKSDNEGSFDKVKSDNEGSFAKAKFEQEKTFEKVKSDNEKFAQEKAFEKVKFEQEKTFEKVKSDHEKLPEKLKPEAEKLPKGEIEKVKPDKEKFEVKEQKLEIEKPPIPEKGIPEGPEPTFPPIDRDTLMRHAEALERMGRELRHFIEQSERPDLNRGALRNEPDQEGGSGGGP